MAYNILIVDDSSVMRTMILKSLRMSGVPIGEVHQASNGKEGLEELNKHWVDLVFVDIIMPIMNGEEMIDFMRKEPHMSSIPVVVISTEGSETRIARLKEKGVEFVHKPFTPETIRDIIKDLVEGNDERPI